MSPQSDEVVVDDPKPGLAGLLAGKNGRIIIAAVVLVLVLLAAGAVVYLFVFSGGTDEIAPPPTGGAPVTTSTAEATAVAPVFRKTRPLSSTFVFRDIFHPTVKATLEATAGAGTGTGGTGTGGTGTGGTGTGGTGTGTGGTSTTEELVLRSTSTTGGVELATFTLNGRTYVLGEGEAIAGTPWQVVSISGRTVTMLYGDTRITLVVGEGVQTSGSSTSGSTSGGTGTTPSK